MKRLLFFVVLMLGLAQVGQAQDTLTAGWVDFNSKQLGFGLKLPVHWMTDYHLGLDPKGEQVILISPANEWLEIGLPAKLNPWLIVVHGPLSEARCLEDRRPLVFQPTASPHGDYWEAIGCRANVEFLAGYWDKDPAKLERRKLLESLHKIK